MIPGTKVHQSTGLFSCGPLRGALRADDQVASTSLATGQIQTASSSIEDAREANGLVTAAVGIGYIW